MLKLKTYSQFTGAPGMLGSLWSNFCVLENQIAQKLFALPRGTAAVVGQRAWFLSEVEGELALGNGSLVGTRITEASFGFEIGLEWVDVDEESLQAEVDALVKVLEEFQTMYIDSKDIDFLE